MKKKHTYSNFWKVVYNLLYVIYIWWKYSVNLRTKLHGVFNNYTFFEQHKSSWLYCCVFQPKMAPVSSPAPNPPTSTTSNNEDSPVNSATALKNRPLSIMASGKGNVLQKAKVRVHFCIHSPNRALSFLISFNTFLNQSNYAQKSTN